MSTRRVTRSMSASLEQAPLMQSIATTTRAKSRGGRKSTTRGRNPGAAAAGQLAQVSEEGESSAAAAGQQVLVSKEGIVGEGKVEGNSSVARLQVVSLFFFFSFFLFSSVGF